MPFKREFVTIAVVASLVCSSAAVGEGREAASRSLSVETVPTITGGVRLIPAPRGLKVDWPVWVSGQRRIVVAGQSSAQPWSSHLYWLTLAGARLDELGISNEVGCPHTSQQAPVGATRDSVAFLQTCWGNFARLPGRAVSLRSYSLAEGASKRLWPFYLPFSTGTFSISREGTAVISNRATRKLMRLTPKGLEPLPLPVVDALDPSWAPNGRTLAFTGSSTVLPDVRSGVYTVHRDGKGLRKVVGNLDNAGVAAWSPNSHWLVVSMKPKQGRSGLWLIAADTGHKRLLVRGMGFGGATWLPDGRTIIATRAAIGPAGKVDQAGMQNGLYIFKLSANALR